MTNFFLYFSDDDLCRRIAKTGNFIIQSFNSKCIHQHGNIKVKNIFLKNLLENIILLLINFIIFFKIEQHEKLISTFKKKIPSYLIKLILKTIFLNFVAATGIFAKLYAYYKFKMKFLWRGGREV